MTHLPKIRHLLFIRHFAYIIAEKIGCFMTHLVLKTVSNIVLLVIVFMSAAVFPHFSVELWGIRWVYKPMKRRFPC